MKKFIIQMNNNLLSDNFRFRKIKSKILSRDNQQISYFRIILFHSNLIKNNNLRNKLLMPKK